MRKLLIITLLVVALSGCSLKNNIRSNAVNNSSENKKVVDLSAQSFEAIATSTLSIPLNWKTYSNKEYKFEFKYPSSSEAIETKISQVNVFNKTRVMDISLEGEDAISGYLVNVYSESYSSIEEFKEWFLKNYGVSTDAKLLEIKERKIGQLNFLDTIDVEGNEGATSHVIYVSGNGSIISFEVNYYVGNASNSSDAEINNVTNLILSTFNFIK